MPKPLRRLARLSLWLLLFALFAHANYYSANDSSRLAAIDALVERGTWAITQSAFSTVDQIKVGAEFYSDKPPMLAFLGAAVYAPLRYGLGWKLEPNMCNGELGPAYCQVLWVWPEINWAYVVLTLVLVTLPATLMLELMYQLARQHRWGAGGAWVFASALGFGTSIFPYSTVLVNHVPAAAAIFGALYVLLTKPPTAAWSLFAGGLAMFSATLDLSTGIFFLALGVYVALTDLRGLRGMLWFGLGGLLPLGLSVVLNLQITGLPWPPQMYPAGYDYPGSPFGATVAGNATASDVGLYIFNLLVGERGLFMFYPLVVFYLWAAWRAAGQGQLLARVVLLGTLGYFAYFALLTDNFGGYVFSPRWLLNPIPLLAVFALEKPLTHWAWRQKILFGSLASFSIFSAYWGAVNPWQPARPIFSLQFTPPQPRTDIAVVFSGYDRLYTVPEALRHGLPANRVANPRFFYPDQGWVVPPGPAWWFVREVPLFGWPPALRQQLPATEGAYYIDLRPAAAAWVQQVQTATVIYALAPDAPTVTLPITLGEEFTLLGTQMQQAHDQVFLLTAWQLERPTTHQLQVFAHLVAANGAKAAQGDAWPADSTSLQAGDWVFVSQTINLAEVAAGTYQVYLGVYDLKTGDRLYSPGGWDTLIVGEVIK